MPNTKPMYAPAAQMTEAVAPVNSSDEHRLTATNTETRMTKKVLKISRAVLLFARQRIGFDSFPGLFQDFPGLFAVGCKAKPTG